MRPMIVLIALLMARGAPLLAADAREEEFENDVRPVLAGTCFSCHGGKKTSGGLRVDSRAALLKGGDSGPAVVPGDAPGSLLVQAVRYEHDDVKMPPDRRLSPGVVDAFSRWVAQGAIWPEARATSRGFDKRGHWAFEPVRANDPPCDPTGWATGPVDRFIAEGWSRQGLRGVGPADRRTLLRRATFDLLGLPPTPGELAAFLADASPHAWEHVVDRLLASPRYGERWGRHWLDVARYADTAGDNADYPIPEIALYRDYVIDAFNKDKPFDQFVREQIAGDILAVEGPTDRYAERVVATGFVALSRRYATAPFELMHLTIEDTIDTTGRAFLGLTLRCARCHDHKFDPITTRDYYGLYGIFASTTFPYAGSEEFQSKNFPRSGFVPLVPSARSARTVRDYQAELSRRESEVKQFETQPSESRRLNDARNALALLKRPGSPPGLPVAYAVAEGKPVKAPIQRAGDPGQPGPEVPHAVPESLAGPAIPRFRDNASGRRELADWIASAQNPLTARVFVNRVWQHHFGRGIVGTPSNFGLRGDEPSHPELLDWLASRFVAAGWSTKALHRLILLSSTYQLASRNDDANAAKDPDDRFLWRFPPRRLDAEAIRDGMLAISGRLDAGRPGPHPFPPISDWHWTQHNAFKAVYASNHRTVYLMTQRLQRHPFLALFDGPDTNVSTESRTRSTVPLQALYLRNAPFVLEQADGLASRLLAHASDDRERIAWGVALNWGRPPSDEESARMLGFLTACQAVPEWAALPAAERERKAWGALSKVLLTADDFLYLD